MSKKEEIKGEVILDLNEELNDSELNDKNTEELAELIRDYWESYLKMDKDSISEYLSDNVRKMSQRNRKLLDGSEAVLEDLPDEWTAFERPDHLISEKMTICHINIWADDESSPKYAIVSYWVDIEGGVRWYYTDQGLVLQVFKKVDGDWKLVLQTDGWATDYDWDEKAPGEEPTFIFDYAYPVKDLDRAVKFYTPILGEPDYVTDTQAYFGLKDPGFILDSSGLFGYSEIKKDLCNGYGVIYVTNLEKEIEKMKEAEVEFLEDTDSEPKKWKEDLFVIIKDAAGNIILVLERKYSSDEGDSEVKGFDEDSEYVEAAKAVAEAWMGKDTETISSYVGKKGFWFDNSKLTNRGVHEGSEELTENLKKQYWKNLDYTEDGIIGIWEAENIKEISLGDYTIVTYERSLEGSGNHPVKVSSFVTHIFESPNKLKFTFINNSTVKDSMALEVDYTANPVLSIKDAEEFYTEQLKLGELYDDEGWLGYWSNNAVYGVYKVDKGDKLLHDEKSNGYVSFWIRSAEETNKYLKKMDVKFPLIESINTKKGVDAQHGYVQVVCSDSEGNIVLFSEYTGRRK
ncbi:MAG TPA: hypothetical protein PL048_11050 [Leptospiraceae bacterium]|nr:hypothetical protein [Leptospiraceae bacterium]